MVKEVIDKLIDNKLNKQEIYSIICIVDSFNGSDKTCVCIPVNGGAHIEDVRVQAAIGLSNEGIQIIPLIDSKVVVSFLSKETAYISLYSEINGIYIDSQDIITFNGGTNSGLIKIIDITTKLNQLVSEINAQLGLIASGIIAGGGTYSPTLISDFNQSDYENTNIIH